MDPSPGGAYSGDISAEPRETEEVPWKRSSRAGNTLAKRPTRRGPAGQQPEPRPDEDRVEVGGQPGGEAGRSAAARAAAQARHGAARGARRHNRRAGAVAARARAPLPAPAAGDRARLARARARG